MERIMKRLKKFWQGLFLTGLAVGLMPFIDFMKMSLTEYIVLVMFAVNIALEFLDICTGE